MRHYAAPTATLGTVPPSKTNRSQGPWLHAELASFGYALKGIRVLWRTQPHARFHSFATVLLLGLVLWLSPSRSEIALLLMATTSVWLAEAFNTCVEFLVDLVHPEWHELAGRIKDVAAGAVLIAAVGALLLGLIILGPLIFKELGYLST